MPLTSGDSSRSKWGRLKLAVIRSKSSLLQLVSLWYWTISISPMATASFGYSKGGSAAWQSPEAQVVVFMLKVATLIETLQRVPVRLPICF